MTSLHAMAAATPVDRDRYVDFLRAFSIVTVVLGHYFIALIHWEQGRISIQNVVGHQSGLWLATWILQVMPIFFFVGGFSNSAGWRSTVMRGEGYRAYLRRRLNRLLRPTAAFVGAWLVVETILHITGVGAPGLMRATFVPFGPLWFLLVYTAMVALAPPMLRLHQRWGWRVPTALLGMVAMVDAARFGFDVGGIGWANLLLVWLLVHQLGFFYADGSLVAAGRRAWWAMTFTGLAVLVVLTNLVSLFDVLWYPRSMVGVDIEPVSNMSPPSVAIVALALWQVGLAMLLRRRTRTWLESIRVWKMVIAVNSVIMTLFLWHLTAYLVAIVALYPLGLGRPIEATASWWVQRPIWLLAPLAILVPIMAVFSRFERVGNRRDRATTPAGPAARGGRDHRRCTGLRRRRPGR